MKEMFATFQDSRCAIVATPRGISQNGIKFINKMNNT